MFSELVIGDTINARGPKGQFNYSANLCREIGMIAGGTGLTPMLQVRIMTDLMNFRLQIQCIDPWQGSPLLSFCCHFIQEEGLLFNYKSLLLLPKERQWSGYRRIIIKGDAWSLTQINMILQIDHPRYC